MIIVEEVVFSLHKFSSSSQINLYSTFNGMPYIKVKGGKTGN
jgi:hypothetical protein